MRDLPRLYAHPFSAYCWKVLVPLYEMGIPFDYRRLGEETVDAEWRALWPFARMPLLVDGGAVVPEATIIVEYLQLVHGGNAAMIPADPLAALDVRRLDRVADNYLSTPMQTIVFDAIRDEADRDPYGVARAKDALDQAYDWWNGHMQGREWAADAFGLADCAAFPALFYCDWIRPIPDRHDVLRAYRARLLARPSIARVVDEARPYRAFFPLGAPDRD